MHSHAFGSSQFFVYKFHFWLLTLCSEVEIHPTLVFKFQFWILYDRIFSIPHQVQWDWADRDTFLYPISHAFGSWQTLSPPFTRWSCEMEGVGCPTIVHIRAAQPGIHSTPWKAIMFPCRLCLHDEKIDFSECCVILRIH